jgi:hypothetical protein
MFCVSFGGKQSVDYGACARQNYLGESLAERAGKGDMQEGGTALVTPRMFAKRRRFWTGWIGGYPSYPIVSCGQECITTIPFGVVEFGN